MIAERFGPASYSSLQRWTTLNYTGCACAEDDLHASVPTVQEEKQVFALCVTEAYPWIRVTLLNKAVLMRMFLTKSGFYWGEKPSDGSSWRIS